MNEAAYVGLYWGAREESVAAVSGRLGAFLSAIGSVTPLLASWGTKGTSPTDTSRIDPGTEKLAGLVASGAVADGGLGGSAAGGLGFSVGMWNGDLGASADLSVRAGNGVAIYGMTPNNVVLTFAAPGGGPLDVVYEPEVAKRIMEAAVSAWSPDWGTWCTGTLRRSQGATDGGVVAGWSTYLADSFATVGSGLVSGIRVDRRNEGTMIVLDGEPQAATVRAVGQVSDAIALIGTDA